MTGDTYVAPLELKFTSDVAGEFEGYGAVFGNEDSHGDVILPGAFAESLAEHKAQGTMPGLYVEHAQVHGTALPAGVWTSLEEDERGLRGKGKISALDSDYGRRVRALMQDGALKGLSIAYRVPPGGAVYGKKSGEPKRTLKAVRLAAVDLVTSPSNTSALVHSVKSLLTTTEKDSATAAVGQAITLFQASMTGGDSPTADERTAMLGHLQDAFEALTGSRMPAGIKSKPNTIREFEQVLRDAGFSNNEARALAEHGFKSQPRDEGREQATADPLSGLDLGGFSLPKF